MLNYQRVNNADWDWVQNKLNRVCVTIYTSASGNRIGLNHFPLISMFKPTPITVYCTISFLFMHPGVINKPKGLKRSLFPITEHFVPTTEPIHQYSK